MTAEANPPNPFKGLKSYDETDRQRLFGRDRDLILMSDRISSGRTTLLFAGSGVGKTSFLKAKIVPEMRRQYSVVLQNRWTGVEEHDRGDVRAHEAFKLWPPQFLVGGWWRRIRRLWERPVSATAGDAITAANAGPSALELEVHRAIAQSLRPAPPLKRLSEVLAVFRKDAGNRASLTGEDSEKDSCILILDQFEEIFQYHAFEPYFGDFVNDLCNIINDQQYQVRVVFSMREEFLGELSVFDNRISDLFSNYYRLKYPDKDEAADIIRRTASLGKISIDNKEVSVATDEEKLEFLIDDLSKIEKGSNAGGGAGGTAGTRARIVRRTFVAPPYLQIACERLWAKQYLKAKETIRKRGAAPVDPNISRQPFLANYVAGGPEPSDVPGKEPGGDAQRVLNEFCKESLDRLTPRQQDIAARAFGFLVTKQGAKMAYELGSLATHMRVRVGLLSATLGKLSDAHILRQSPGPEKSLWFELYHDMYAGIVDRWKRRYDRERVIRNRWTLAGTFGLPILLLLILYTAYHWGIHPYQNTEVLVAYKNALKTPEIRRDQEYNSPEAVAHRSALDAYRNLREVRGYGGRADRLWAEVLQRRAQLFEREERRDEALITLLQAAAINPKNSSQYLREASLLAGSEYSALQATYLEASRMLRLSADGKILLSMTPGGTVRIRELSSEGRELILCKKCSDAFFSSDGKLVVTVAWAAIVDPRKTDAVAGRPKASNARVNRPAGKAQDYGAQSATGSPAPEQTSMGWQALVWDSATWRETGSATFFENSADFRANSNKRTLNDSPPATAATRGQASPPPDDFNILAASNSDSGVLFAGKMGGKLAVWRADGMQYGSSMSFPVNLRSATELVKLSFSPDGKFLAGGPITSNIGLWQLANGALIPDSNISQAIEYDFSPDSKFFVVANSSNAVDLWNLRTHTLTKSIPSDMTPQSLQFTADSSAFAITYDKAIGLWNSENGEPRAPTVEFTDDFLRVARDGRSALTIEVKVETDSEFVKKWDLQPRKQTGTLQLFGVRQGQLNPEGQSMVTSAGGSIRVYSIPSVQSDPAILPTGERFAGLSEDGSTMLGMHGNSKAELWKPEGSKNTPVVAIQDSNPADNNFILSPGGNQVGLIDQHEIRVWNAKNSWSKVSLPYEGVRSITFSPDSRFMALATVHSIYVLETANYGLVTTLASALPTRNVQFSRDGKYIRKTVATSAAAAAVAKSDERPTTGPQPVSKAIEIWALPEGKEIILSEKINQEVLVAAFSDTGQLITSLENESKATVWSLPGGAKVGELVLDAPLATVMFSPDGKWSIAGDNKGVLTLWRIGETISRVNQLELGSPANRMIFGSGGNSVIVGTSPGGPTRWVHLLNFGEQGFTYVSGIPTDGARMGSPWASQGGQAVRFLKVRDGGMEVVTLRFDGGEDAGAFGSQAANPTVLLDIWMKKLSFVSDYLGQLVRPERDDDDAAEEGTGGGI
ncbi:MAG: hypothetical protein QOE77_911 [Blastocatellia bacterium]|jgi:WD40 repeat protein|nr:hypothetical protein [Blastocatellia bacterium]